MSKDKEFEEDNKILTVKSLNEIFTNLVENGFGDFKIKADDAYIHEDEFDVYYMKEEFRIRGNIFHEDMTAKAQQLKQDIKKAVDKFYGFGE